MHSSFHDKVILVTGATSGIGRELTLMLLSLGAKVVASARSQEKLQELAEEAPIWRDSLCTVVCDVARRDDVDAMVSFGMKRFQRVDGLVNNAGLYPSTPMLEMTEAEWDQVLGTNLKGPFLCSQATAKAMIATGARGRIVNISSTASLVARPGTVHYASSKSGLNMLTKVMAIELAPHGIRVNCVVPGLITTEGAQAHMENRANTAEHATKLGRIPMRQAGIPADVARAAIHLMADESNYTTGALLVVDGGYSLGISSYS